MKLDVTVHDPRNQFAQIYFNGVKQEWVYQADEEAGTITRAVLTGCGKPSFINGDAVTETVHGDVKIKLPEGYELTLGKLRELMGFVSDGSNNTIILNQEDVAPYEFTVSCRGAWSVTEPTFEAAINKAWETYGGN